MRANQLGYLRLGIEFLKAAYASPESGGKDALLKLDLGYLEAFDHHSYSFERREDVWSPMWPEEPASAASAIYKVVAWLVGLFFAPLFMAPRSTLAPAVPRGAVRCRYALLCGTPLSSGPADTIESGEELLDRLGRTQIGW